MAGVNKVILIGHLGKDPEVRYTQGNIPVAMFSVATSESWKDKNTNEWHEKTEWHRVVAWRHLAEKAEKFLRKGKQVYVEGKLETRKWTDDNGVDRYTTEIVARVIQMLGKRDDDGTPHPASNNGFGTPPANDQAQPQGAGGYSPPPDDDLPF